MKSSARKGRGPKSTQLQQTLATNSGERLTSDTQERPVEMQDPQAFEEKQPLRERARKPRRPSATPQPETPRLRLHIKETAKGQHLSAASKHRMALHQQSLLETPKANKSNSSELVVKEEAMMRRITPAPILPPANVTRHNFPQFEGAIPFRPTGQVPGQIVYHPTYGWGWVPEISLPNQDQGISNSEDMSCNPGMPTEGGQQPAAQISRRPLKFPTGDSLLASPFEHRVDGPLRHRTLTPDHVALPSAGHLDSTQTLRINTAGTSCHHSDAGNAEDRGRNDMPSSSNHVENTPLAAVGREPTHSNLSTSEKSRDEVGRPLMQGFGDEFIAPPDPPSKNTQSKQPIAMGEDLAGYLAKLKEHLKAASMSTGLSEDEIISQLKSPDHHVVQDNFALYKNYFFTGVETELNRLPNELRPEDIRDVPDNIIRKAFELFENEVPDSKDFLRDWSSIHRIASSHDFSDRPQQFQRYAAKLETMFRSASLLLGFETISCTVGSRVHEDQALAVTLCSPMVPDFFSGRLRVRECDIIGHLKAHAYDNVSRQTLPNFPLPQSLQHEQSVGSFPGASSDYPVKKGKAAAESSLATACIGNVAVMPSVEAPATHVHEEDQSSDMKQKKSRSKSKDKDQARIDELKKKLFDLTKHCNIKQLLSGNIQLTKLPRILAQNGWVLENWPEDMPFACDCKTGKGVAGLPVQDQISLLRSLNDPAFPLRVVQRSKDPIPPSEPAIIGVPPPHDSQYTHGRRRFLDSQDTCDRKGPPRLTSQHIDSFIVTKEAEQHEIPTSPNLNEVNPKKRPGIMQESNSVEGITTKKVKFEKKIASQAESQSDDESSSSSDSFYGTSQTKDTTNDIASSTGPDMSNYQTPGSRLINPILQDGKGRIYVSDAGVPIDNSRVLQGRSFGFEKTSPHKTGEPENPMVLPASLEENTFCTSEVESSHSPTAFWLPFQQAGQYPLGLPSGPQMMSIPIPVPPAPRAGNQGSNLQHNGPAIPPFVPYPGHQLAPSQPPNNLHFRPSGSHVFPPQFIPRQPETHDPRDYHMGGYYMDHNAHDVSKKPNQQDMNGNR